MLNWQAESYRFLKTIEAFSYLGGCSGRLTQSELTVNYLYR